MTQICVVNCGLPAEQCACYRDRFKDWVPPQQYESREKITVEEMQEIFGDFIPMAAVIEIIENAHRSPAEMRPILRGIAEKNLKTDNSFEDFLGSEAGTDYTSPCCNDAVTALFFKDELTGFRCEYCGRDYGSAEELDQ